MISHLFLMQQTDNPVCLEIQKLSTFGKNVVIFNWDNITYFSRRLDIVPVMSMWKSSLHVMAVDMVTAENIMVLSSNYDPLATRKISNLASNTRDK